MHTNPDNTTTHCSHMQNAESSVQVFTNLATEVSSSTSVLSKGWLSIRVGDWPLVTLQCIPAAKASSFKTSFVNTLYSSLVIYMCKTIKSLGVIRQQELCMIKDIKPWHECELQILFLMAKLVMSYCPR